MRHDGHESGHGGAVSDFRGPFDSVVGFQKYAVFGPMQQSKGEMQLGIPPEFTAVQVPILVEFGKQRKIALASGCPIAELHLAEMNVDQALA
jgi:hypothetical protein